MRDVGGCEMPSLSCGRQNGFMRAQISPGRLYARLNAEFMRLRSAGCHWCRLPVPHLIARDTTDEPNWTIARLPSGCRNCIPIVEALVRKYQAEFDLLDPISRPLRTRTQYRAAARWP